MGSVQPQHSQPSESDSVNHKHAKPTFSIHETLARFDVPISDYLQTQPGIDRLITGAIVFSRDGRMLMIQRAAADYMPNLWEIPGGSVERGRDATLLEAASRELWEESGLRAVAAKGLVDTYEFTDKGRRYQKVTFEFEIESPKEETEEGRQQQHHHHHHSTLPSSQAPEVVLDPEEHQDFAWVSDEEYRAGWTACGRKLDITHPNQEVTLHVAFKMLSSRK